MRSDMTIGPRLSVVVPTYNRAAVLKRCLAALAAQTCGPEVFEVLVGDDGSVDETKAVAEEFQRRGSPRLTYLHQRNAGANTSRNRAIRAARGELILLINDDTIPSPSMLAEHLSEHAAHPEDTVAVLGRVTADPALPYSPLAKLHLDRAFQALGDRREHDWRAFFTCNVSLKRSLLERGGMFEEGIRYHEDLELSERLSRCGLRVIYRPGALGYHDHFLTEEEFFRVAAREARSLAAWARKSPHLIGVLSEFGYEPDPPAVRRMKHQVAALVFNRATIPAWCAAARAIAPRAEPAALAIYLRIYQVLKRAALRAELKGGGS